MAADRHIHLIRHSKQCFGLLADRSKSLIILLILLVALFSLPRGAVAQQAYPSSDVTQDCLNKHPENAGYVCSDAAQTNCETLAYYVVQEGDYSTLESIATGLFGTTKSKLAAANNITDTRKLTVGDSILIPLDCKCVGNHSQYNVSFKLRPEDTFLNLANTTYEGLTTCQAMQEATPGVDVYKLQAGTEYIIPIRCACPSKQQSEDGFKLLLTYPVKASDTANSISILFRVAPQDFFAANSLRDVNPIIFPSTTVLVPLRVKPLQAPSAPKSQVSPPPPSSPTPPPSHKSKAGVYVGIAAAVVVSVVVLVAAAWLMAKRMKSKTRVPPPTPETALLTLRKPKVQEDFLAEMSSLIVAGQLQVYTMDQLKEATDDFSPSYHVKGAVYRGVFKGLDVVAIKKMTRNILQELQILQKVHHVNLVTLLGVCINGPEHVYLVYEYADNGSLSDRLHDHHDVVSSVSFGSSSFLSWSSRLQIALDVATALQYIHDHTSPSFVHKDIKSSNILLDSNFRGKIANFGLAKSTQELQQGAALTGYIVGTQGYMAPEYVSHGLVTPKLDVFAFGVVLLEMISGEEAIMKKEVKGAPLQGAGAFLYESLRPFLERDDAKEKLGDWIDPVLKTTKAYPLDCAFSLAMLAKACVEQKPSSRPSMKEVTYTLAKLLEISRKWESSGVLERSLSRKSVKGR